MAESVTAASNILTVPFGVVTITAPQWWCDTHGVFNAF
jgi:hypothetical protein